MDEESAVAGGCLGCITNQPLSCCGAASLPLLFVNG